MKMCTLPVNSVLLLTMATPHQMAGKCVCVCVWGGGGGVMCEGVVCMGKEGGTNIFLDSLRVKVSQY